MAATNAAIEPIKSVQLLNPRADFQIVQRKIPTPDAGQVRVKIKVTYSQKKASGPGSSVPRSRTQSRRHSRSNWRRCFLKIQEIKGKKR